MCCVNESHRISTKPSLASHPYIVTSEQNYGVTCMTFSRYTSIKRMGKFHENTVGNQDTE